MNLDFIMRIVQLCFSCLSCVFIVGMAIKAIINWIKLRRLEAHDRKVKIAEQKEKELFLALKEKYETLQTK